MNDVRKQDGASSTAVAEKEQSGVRRNEQALMPPVDVIEDADSLTLYADLPGASKETLALHVDNGTLSIEAELALSLPEGLQSSHTEVSVGRFRRSFTLSKELDAEKVSAELSNGVLRLRIPKAEHAKPRRITVNAA
jgi:HSP20 family molecular chaperone IbpA